MSDYSRSCLFVIAIPVFSPLNFLKMEYPANELIVNFPFKKKKVLELENNRRAKILFSSLFFVVLNSTNEFPNMTKKWQTSFTSWVHELELARIEGIIRRISAWKKITFFFLSRRPPWIRQTVKLVIKKKW